MFKLECHYFPVWFLLFITFLTHLFWSSYFPPIVYFHFSVNQRFKSFNSYFKGKGKRMRTFKYCICHLELKIAKWELFFFIMSDSKQLSWLSFLDVSSPFIHFETFVRKCSLVFGVSPGKDLKYLSFALFFRFSLFCLGSWRFGLTRLYFCCHCSSNPFRSFFT